MQTYELERDGDVPVRFTGELVSWASSRSGQTQKRWQELELYKTSGGAYVFNRVGYSDHPGEVDYHFVVSDHAPREIVKAMYHVDDDGIRFLTRLARDFLDDAAAKLPEFRAFVSEEIT